MDETKPVKNRKARRAERKASNEFDTEKFLRTADKFIDVANRENRTVKATDLHMAFLYAAARYNAYVAKVIIDVDEHEKFVEHMVEQYKEMLRQHLADETIEQSPEDSPSPS